ncbi:hypothetical protein EBZ38_17260 [bacterium]|nr:hypothetical protein [bacterium]
MTELEAANHALRSAVESRLAGCQAAMEETNPRSSCASAEQSETYSEWTPPDYARLARATHPTSQAFCDLCDQIKDMHRKKSADYGSATDPLANIRNGAEFVGIEAWRAAMVRLSDKVTRLQTYCRTGRLEHEGVEDTLMDLASYSLLVLLTHREARNQGGS